MGLEERVRDAWEEVRDAAKTKDRLHEACLALFQLLNVPATAFNERTALDLSRDGQAVEAFIRMSDRYLPTFDTESSEKFRAYLDTYRRIRGELAEDDVLAFLRLSPTPALRKTASEWLKGKGSFEWAAPPAKKKA